GVTSGMLLPMVRGRLSRGATVVGCTLSSCAGILVLGLSTHWVPASLGMLLFGIGWTSAYATIQAAAQLVCPAWVRAGALAIYQLAQNGALTVGSFAWGVLGGETGIAHTLLTAAATGLVLAVVARRFPIETVVPTSAPRESEPAPAPEAPAAELVPLLRTARGRVMEIVHYRVQPSERAAFLAVMQEMRHLRGRTGALFWQLYEDVAHPEGWLEVWSVENWTDHLREATRLSDEDRILVARADAYRRGAGRPGRYLAVDPHDHAPTREPTVSAPFLRRPAAGLNSA
ncbi:MAG: MFS transporter, partial [Rhodospirillales bacterium]|nr:MFS transporter [Rhodospirillales bacterium]